MDAEERKILLLTITALSGVDSLRRQRLVIPSETLSAGNPQHYTHTASKGLTHTYIHIQQTLAHKTHHEPWIQTQAYGNKLEWKTFRWRKHARNFDTYTFFKYCNELKQQTNTHTHTLDKALSKDNKLREFRHISESHKSPSWATSSERTADNYMDLTTVKCPMKCNNVIGVLSLNGIRREYTLQQPLQCTLLNRD